MDVPDVDRGADRARALPDPVHARRGAVRAARVSLLALCGLTTVHHVYGALVDGSDQRLHAIAVVIAPVGVGVAALEAFSRKGRRRWAVVYAAVAWSLGLLLGGVHSGYSHVYKDLLHLVGGPADLYVRLNPDEHYPPDDVFFELTGVLELGLAVWVVVAAVRLVRTARRGGQGASTSAPAPASGVAR